MISLLALNVVFRTRMRNSRSKKSHNFQGLLLLSILYDDFLKFFKNRDKEFYLNFPRTAN